MVLIIMKTMDLTVVTILMDSHKIITDSVMDRMEDILDMDRMALDMIIMVLGMTLTVMVDIVVTVPMDLDTIVMVMGMDPTDMMDMVHMVIIMDLGTDLLTMEDMDMAIIKIIPCLFNYQDNYHSTRKNKIIINKKGSCKVKN